MRKITIRSGHVRKGPPLFLGTTLAFYSHQSLTVRKCSPRSGSRQCCRSLNRKCIQLRKLCSQNPFRLVRPNFSNSFFQNCVHFHYMHFHFLFFFSLNVSVIPFSFYFHFRLRQKKNSGTLQFFRASWAQNLRDPDAGRFLFRI